MEPLFTISGFWLPVSKLGLRDITIITTLYNPDPHMSYGRVQGFYVPAGAASDTDFTLLQYNARGMSDISWPVEVMKQKMLQEWRRRHADTSSAALTQESWGLEKLQGEGWQEVKALAAVDYFQSLRAVSRAADNNLVWDTVNDLLNGRLPGHLEQIHPPLSRS